MMLASPGFVRFACCTVAGLAVIGAVGCTESQPTAVGDHVANHRAVSPSDASASLSPRARVLLQRLDAPPGPHLIEFGEFLAERVSEGKMSQAEMTTTYARAAFGDFMTDVGRALRDRRVSPDEVNLIAREARGHLGLRTIVARE